MAITNAQLNAGKALTLDKLFVRYPDVHARCVRIVIQGIKTGNATEREVGKALLNQAFQAIFGINPNANQANKHRFKHWLHQFLDDPSDGQTTGIDGSDAFEAESITVT